MKFGVQVSCYNTDWEKIKSSIETLEEGRWNSLWFADHFFHLLQDHLVVSVIRNKAQPLKASLSLPLQLE